MARHGWHTLRDPGAVTVARHLPARFDLCARTAFPPARMGRLAHQIRQDLWRELRGLRGFSPVVRVEQAGAGLAVTAGGRAAAPVPRRAAEARIAALLSSPAHRARWMANARPEHAA